MLSHPDGASSVTCQKIHYRHDAMLQLTRRKHRVNQDGACCTNYALSLTDLCNYVQDFEHDIQLLNRIKTGATGKFVPATGA